jgi:hypothetical protein
MTLFRAFLNLMTKNYMNKLNKSKALMSSPNLIRAMDQQIESLLRVHQAETMLLILIWFKYLLMKLMP